LIALAAACSGHVEERNESEVAGGSGGIAINPTGVGGTHLGGSSGDGVGGTFGWAGTYGEFGGTTGFGTGGDVGDAGAPFGGTSGGGTGGRCNPRPWVSEQCAPTQRCIDPYSPTSERIALNQPVFGDAGSFDGGTSDATARSSEAGNPSPVDAGPSDGPETDGHPPDGGTGIVGADICSGTRVTPAAAYLAFDLWSGLEKPAVVLYSANPQCSGSVLGYPQFSYSVPPAYVWTTQCVELPRTLIGRVIVAPNSAGAAVQNLRFVADCRCPRPLVVPTSCGWDGQDAGLICKPG
jgi:hypothetical protein